MGLREREKTGKGVHTSLYLANQWAIAKPSQTSSCACESNASSLPMAATPSTLANDGRTTAFSHRGHSKGLHPRQGG